MFAARKRFFFGRPSFLAPRDPTVAATYPEARPDRVSFGSRGKRRRINPGYVWNRGKRHGNRGFDFGPMLVGLAPL
jgi:hypothetical protein